MTYVTYLFGFPVGSFPHPHGRVVAAVPRARHLGGAGAGRIALALWRRMRDRGALTLQDFAMDFLPLILLFAISVTGLGAHRFHAVAARRVLRLPRDPARDHRDRRAAVPAVRQVLPHLPAARAARREALPRAGERDEGAHCARCGERFASRMQIDDLRARAAAARLRLPDRRVRPAHGRSSVPPASARRSPPRNCRMKEEARG